MWLERERSWLACLPHYPTNSVSCSHFFAYTRISLLSLSGLYCTNYRKTEIPNGPTPLYSTDNRGSSKTSTVYPIQYHDLAVLANPCQLLFFETHARNIPGVRVIFNEFPFRHITSSRKRRRIYPHVCGGRTLWVIPVFTTSLSALHAGPYPHTLTCPRERCEASGACSGSAAWYNSSATVRATAPSTSPSLEHGPRTSLRARATLLATCILRLYCHKIAPEYGRHYAIEDALTDCCQK